MIQDAEQMEDGAGLHAQVCVVGAGPAGIALALRLAESGISVLVLESGGMEPEADAQALYDGSVADATLHSAPMTYRQRRFGGSSTIWGGRCVPFDPIDFRKRSWIAHSGWPIGPDDLAPHYEAANRLCEAGAFSYDARIAMNGRSRAPLRGLHGTHFTDHTLERFSCPTDFGQRYRERLVRHPSIRVVLHANVTRIVTDSSNNVAGLTIRTLGGRTLEVTANSYVLATGGLETPRLLLAQGQRRGDAGLGNEHDWVGRSYMCHIAGTHGELHPADPEAVYHGYDVSSDGVYCRRRLALSEAAQERLRVGNFIARLHHPRIPDPSHRTGALSALYFAKPFISYEYGKRLHGGQRAGAATIMAHMRNLVMDPFGTAGFLAHWVRRRTLAERKFPSIIIRPRRGVYSIDFNAEQEPNRASRVTLGREVDALGMRKIAVDWRYTQGDMRTVRLGMAALAQEIAQSGCGKLLFDREGVQLDAIRDGAYGGHHVGTARMSAVARDGVVNGDCRLHGVGNLYIASSAVFPTSSQANPTLTIVAMALRLAEHLRQRHASTSVVATAA